MELSNSLIGSRIFDSTSHLQLVDHTNAVGPNNVACLPQPHHVAADPLGGCLLRQVVPRPQPVEELALAQNPLLDLTRELPPSPVLLPPPRLLQLELLLAPPELPLLQPELLLPVAGPHSLDIDQQFQVPCVHMSNRCYSGERSLVCRESVRQHVLVCQDRLEHCGSSSASAICDRKASRSRRMRR